MGMHYGRRPGSNLSSRIGLMPETAASSALEIKNTMPNARDGLYWIKNENVNGGNPIQVYCDMTKDGGGWILALDVTVLDMDWTTTNIGLRNETTPSLTEAYSIIDWIDYFRRTDTTWQWMIEASLTSHTERYYGGGIFHSDPSHIMNTTTLQSGAVADEWFPNPGNHYAFNTDNGIGVYCPHKGGYNYGSSSIFTTDDNDSSWWGCIVQGNANITNFGTGPWRSSTQGNMVNTAHKRVWVR